MKVWIAAIAKCEERYIREWIDWHKKIGVDHILLADNNEMSHTPCLCDVIQDFIDEGYVDVIDYRDKKGCQLSCYEDLYHNYNEADWIAFIDIDEFIILPAYNDIHEFLQFDADVVSLPWMIYDDNDQLYYEDRPVMERFTRSLNPGKSQMCKSIWRKGLTIPINQHAPKDECNIVDCLGNEDPLDRHAHHGYIKFDPKMYETAYVAHYMFKSTQEFIDIKMTRGRVLTNKVVRHNVQFYFMYNKKTGDKIRMFKQHAISTEKKNKRKERQNRN